jgi:secreted Zn-dependent insulinase-like peptidase
MKKICEIIKSKSDLRNYRSVTLENRLKCILIQDKDTEKSGACMNVGIGSLTDPLNYQGLSHFLEHMLFLGSTKYPEQSVYKQHISKYSGNCNAYTSNENTNYYF